MSRPDSIPELDSRAEDVVAEAYIWLRQKGDEQKIRRLQRDRKAGLTGQRLLLEQLIREATSARKIPQSLLRKLHEQIDRLTRLG